MNNHRCTEQVREPLPSLKAPTPCLTVRKPLNQHSHVALEAIDSLILCHAVCYRRIRSEHRRGGKGSERRAPRSAWAAIGAEPSQQSVGGGRRDLRGSRPRGELCLLPLCRLSVSLLGWRTCDLQQVALLRLLQRFLRLTYSTYPLAGESAAAYVRK